jgi:ABC-type bacteriocin/lantibiotic exporter with double-glycine peptidase domain
MLVLICCLSPAAGTLLAGDLPRESTSSPPLPAESLSGVANLIRVPLIRQDTGYTCGVSSLQSIFAYYGQDYRADKLAEALKTTPSDGTDYKDIIRVALINGYHVQKVTGMTIDHLKACIDARTPVLLAIQAWPEKPVNWSQDWDDGHYVVAIGYDEVNFYFMDPSTVGNYTYIRTDKFLSRWHDKDQRGQKLIQFGIVIDGKKPEYNPEQIKPLG